MSWLKLVPAHLCYFFPHNYISSWQKDAMSLVISVHPAQYPVQGRLNKMLEYWKLYTWNLTPRWTAESISLREDLKRAIHKDQECLGPVSGRMEERACIAGQRLTVNSVPEQSATWSWRPGFIAAGILWVIFVSFIGMSPGLNQGTGKAMDEVRLYKETSTCCFKCTNSSSRGGSKGQRMVL